MGLAIGVDIGGSKIAAGVVDDTGRILESIRLATPTAGLAIIDAVSRVIGDFGVRHAITAVGVAAAGLVDRDRTTIRYAPNLPWRDEPLADRVAERCGLSVVVENDANAAAWAEARFGAGRGEPNLVMVTLGTGIGGGVVLDGRLQRGQDGFAAELGHLLLTGDGDGVVCGCGNHGCWETLASGPALVRAARRRARDAPTQASRLLELAGDGWQSIDGPHVTQAAADGDPAALQSIAVVARWTGRGLASIAALLDVNVFILGGGVAAAGETLRRLVQDEAQHRVVGRDHRRAVQVRLAGLGADAGVIGAADLATRCGARASTLQSA